MEFPPIVTTTNKNSKNKRLKEIITIKGNTEQIFVEGSKE